MPSHIAHLLHAQEVISPDTPTVQDRAWIALGAQGPDLFYHNQRRRPTGIQYGTLIHRHGYGSVIAAMVRWTIQNGYEPHHGFGHFIRGYVTHAILDRLLHPYINYRAGWPVQGKPGTERYRSMHAFLERLIDAALLQERYRITPNELDFFQILTPLAAAGDSEHMWLRLNTAALREVYQRARDDQRLEERLANAWRDSLGYYEFTRQVDTAWLEAGLEREATGRVRHSWLSIIHPPSVPEELDVLNLRHREWTHPCSSKRRSTASVIDLFSQAVNAGREVDTVVTELWEKGTPELMPRMAEQIVEQVGDQNLSDGRPRRRPCHPRHMDPLPLPELQERMRDSIRRGRGGVV